MSSLRSEKKYEQASQSHHHISQTGETLLPFGWKFHSHLRYRKLMRSSRHSPFHKTRTFVKGKPPRNLATEQCKTVFVIV